MPTPDVGIKLSIPRKQPVVVGMLERKRIVPYSNITEFFRRALRSESSATDPADTDTIRTTGLRNIGHSGIKVVPPLFGNGTPLPPPQVDPDLGTVHQAQQTSQFAHCRVYIHGIYAGAHFDGGLNGNTGEWYFASLVTDGREIVGVGSMGMGDDNGRWVNVSAGSWLDTGDRLIWPKTEDYNEVADLGVPNGNIKIALNVMEDDDGELAKSILSKVGKISRAWLDQQFPGNIPASVTHDQILSLAQDAIDIYAADDRPLSEEFSLDQNGNYRIGQFIKVPGHQGSFAILSVQPKGNADTDLYQIERHDLPPLISERKISLTTDANTPRLVAVFIRPSMIYQGIPSTKVEVLNDLYEGRSFKVTSRPGVFHTMVNGGSDDITIRVFTPVGASMRVMATAVSKEGAAQFSD